MLFINNYEVNRDSFWILFIPIKCNVVFWGKKSTDHVLTGCGTVTGIERMGPMIFMLKHLISITCCNIAMDAF